MKNKKKLIKYSVYFFSVLLAIYLISSFFVKQKIEKKIEELALKNKVSITTTTKINLLHGDFSFLDVKIEKDSFSIQSKLLKIEDISYYHILFNKQLSITNLKVIEPQILGKIADFKIDNTKVKDSSKTALKNITINQLEVINGFVHISNANNNDIKVKSFDLKIDKLTNRKENHKFPFSYENIFFKADSIDQQVSIIQQLKINNISLKNNTFTISKLALQPLKPNNNYINYVKEEKDLYDINLDSLKIVNIDITKKEKYAIAADSINIYNGDFNIYADKTRFLNSKKIKDLYSKALRELNFLICINQLNIKDSKLTYEELLKKENKPGLLVFEKLNVITNKIDNSTDNTNKQVIIIDTEFMGSSPLHVNYEFKIQDVSDNFRIRGTLKNVTSKNMSSYISPALNVSMDGFINRMDFDFEGNNWSSNGKFDVMFKDFKVKINKKKKKNKFLSWLANVIIKDTSKNGLITVDVKEVKRNQTKSFWNFFWKNIEEGLIKSVL